MGYSIDAVRAFERDGKNLEEQCRKLFESWLSTGCSRTWQTLLDHLRKVDDLTAAVEEIEKELINCKD